MKMFLIGLIVGLVVWPIGVLCYLFFGSPPVAVGEGPLPLEHPIRSAVLSRRVSSQAPKKVPIQPTETNLMAGAQIYVSNCAACHGTYNETTTFSQHMYPWPQPMWRAYGPKRAIGVSDDPPGRTYWKIANGIRLTGMPAFKQALTPEQIWQVTVLLANANKPLPPAVQEVLRQPLNRQPVNGGMPIQPIAPVRSPVPIQPVAPPPSVPAQPTRTGQPSGTGQPGASQQPSGGSQPSGANQPSNGNPPGQP